MDRARASAGLSAPPLECLCLFVGPPRSGTTLMGSVLDSHPAIAISTELDLLARLDAGAGGETLLREIREASARQAREGMRWNGYDYGISGQHQGRSDGARVLGDKRAARTVIALDERPERLERLERTLGAPARFVHMIRNPFDAITTIARKRERPLDEKIASYFEMHAQVERLARRVGEDRVLRVHLADLAARPQTEIACACRFLGVEATPAWVEAAAALVFAEPRTTRHEVDWTPARVARIEAACAADAWLKRYRFAGASPATAARSAS